MIQWRRGEFLLTGSRAALRLGGVQRPKPFKVRQADQRGHGLSVARDNDLFPLPTRAVQ